MKIFISALLLLASLCIYFFILDGVEKKPVDHFSCEANMRYQDSSLDEPLMFTGTITFNIGAHQRGSMVLNGKIEKSQRSYKVLRLLHFSYLLPKSNEYRLQLDKPVVMGKDNIPDDLFAEILSKASIRDEMSLYISETGKNAVSIGSLSSPMMVCVFTE